MEPVGPLPPSVYRRRRAVAVGLVVALLGLLTWGVGALAGPDGEAEDPGAGKLTAEAPPVPRPASFAAAEQAQRERKTTGRSTPSSARPAPADPAGALLAPPTGSGQGLLPGSLLGPMTSGQGGNAAPSGAPRGAAAAAAPPAPSAPADPSAPGAPSARGAPSGPGAPSDAPGTAGAPAGPAARAAPPAPCSDRVIAVAARTDKPRYGPGDKPTFSLVVTNTGPATCRRDLDASRQALAVVRKPGDGLWGSEDCAPGGTPDVRTLRPGEQAVFSLRWSGLTSTPGCAPPREPVAEGNYQLLARLDATISEPAPFVLER